MATGNRGGRGKQAGDPGVPGGGVKLSPEDEALSRRRYTKYISLTRDKKPGSYDFKDILPLLPEDGGTIQHCGHTRFYHVIYEEAPCEVQPSSRCGRLLKNGETCARKKNHTIAKNGRGVVTHGCQSERSIQRVYERRKLATRKKREAA